jgi:hypothetical protein
LKRLFFQQTIEKVAAAKETAQEVAHEMRAASEQLVDKAAILVDKAPSGMFMSICQNKHRIGLVTFKQIRFFPLVSKPMSKNQNC